MTKALAKLPFALFLLMPGTPSLAAQPEPERAIFAPCGASPRVTCVVDGDTFWYAGTKIRIADINTPETTQASCPEEAALGDRAKGRLLQLLNAGPFTLEVQGRAADRYGRALRVVTRGGKSLGALLKAEGLAEHWQGRRGNWCERPLS